MNCHLRLPVVPTYKPPFILLLSILISIFSQSILAQEPSPSEIIGGNTPDEFVNFSDMIPNPDYTGDVTYTIPLGTVHAGGILDFPLKLTYNTNRVRAGASSGLVGYGWDFNIGEVVRSVVGVPDEQNASFFGPTEYFELASYSGDVAAPGMLHGGDNQPRVHQDEWDNYNLSTPYHSKMLVPIHNNAGSGAYFLETPFENWIIDYVRAAPTDYFSEFSLIDNMGRKFDFDYAHYVRIDQDGDGVKTSVDELGNHYYIFPTLWKLTRIEHSNENDYVDIVYDGYGHVDDLNNPFTTNSVVDGVNLHSTTIPSAVYGHSAWINHDLSVIEEINTRFQKVKFFYQSDPNNYGSPSGTGRKLLDRIEIYSQKDLNNPIRVIDLDYTSSTAAMQPGFLGSRGISVLQSVEIQNPSNVLEGQEYSFEYYPNTNPTPDLFGFVGTANMLKKIDLPTGGSIEYEYEERKYSFYREYETYLDGLTTKYRLRQRYASDNTAPEYLAGVRVKKMNISGKANSPDIVKDFLYGEGVRTEQEYESILYNHPSLSPSSRLMGHIGHRWVEIRDSANNGFEKTHYTSSISRYLKDPESCLNTTDCPTLITDGESEGIGFYNSDYAPSGYLPLYRANTEAYGLAYKTEVGYYSGGSPITTHETRSNWVTVFSDQTYPNSNISVSQVNDYKTSLFVYKVADTVKTDGKEQYNYYAGYSYANKCPQLCRTPFTSEYHFVSNKPEFNFSVDASDNNLSYLTESFYTRSVMPDMATSSLNMMDFKMGEFTVEEKDFSKVTYGPLWALTQQLEDPLIKYPGLNLSIYSSSTYYQSGHFTYWNNSDGTYRPRETWAFTKSDLGFFGEAGDALNPLCDPGPATSCRNYPYSSNGRLLQQYDIYNSYGDLVQSTDGNGVNTSYERSGNGVAIGVFTNTSSNNVFAHSFAYDGLSGWTYTDEATNNFITTWTIENGKLKMSHPGGAPGSWSVDQYRISLDAEYSGRTIIELDVTAGASSSYSLTIGAGGNSWLGTNGGSENLVWTSFYYGTWRAYNGSWHEIASGLVKGETYQLKIIADPITDTIDFYVDGELKLSNLNGRTGTPGIQTISIGNYGRSTTPNSWYVDNVRIYPESANALTQEVDPAYGHSIAIKDVSGNTVRFRHDSYGRLTSEVNPNGNITTAYNYQYSPELNGGDYLASSPNSVETVIYSTDDGFKAPNASSGLYKWGDTSYDYLIDGETAVRVGYDNSGWDGFRYLTYTPNGSIRADLYIDPIVTSGNALPVQILNSSGNQIFALRYESVGGLFLLHVKKGSGTWLDRYTFPITAIPGKWYTVEIERSNDGSEATMWVYPKGSGRNYSVMYTESGYPAGEPMRFQSEGGLNDNFYISNLYIGQTLQNISYADGLGRKIQTQSSGGTETIITDNRYNEVGLANVISRPISINRVNTYQQKLLEGTGSFTPGGALHNNSPVENYYDPLVATDDEDYAYSYTEYEESMARRLFEITLPGNSHKSGSGNETVLSYGLNTAIISTPNKSWAIGTLYKSVNQDPSDNESITYTNYLGQTVASGINMNPTSDDELVAGSSDLITTFEYDYNGNLVLVEDPEGMQTTYSYNALGELLEKKLPDQDHPNKYCYDSKGRLRFHADPNDFANPTDYFGDKYLYMYTRYDVFDRPTEVGRITAYSSSHNTETSFEHACASQTTLDTQSEPDVNTETLVDYTYDGEGAYTGARNLQGQLTRSRTISFYYSGSPVWNTTWYSYNELGLVEWVQYSFTHTVSTTISARISYGYDELGRLTKTSYEEGSNTFYHWQEYDGLGRLHKVYTNEADNYGTASLEAEYTYFADGQVKQLILGDGVQTMDYTYTVQGWLQEINDASTSSLDRFAMLLRHNNDGNIWRADWFQSIWDRDYSGNDIKNYFYSYDNAGRLSSAGFSFLNNNGIYDVAYTYDKSGNLITLDRYSDGNDPNYFFDYVYYSGTNRLKNVQGDASTGFTYDANGNMETNVVQGITASSYNWRNQPLSVTANGTNIYYGYDHQGNRIKKSVSGGATTYYVRGADGQTIAAYDGSGNLLFFNILAGGRIIGQLANH